MAMVVNGLLQKTVGVGGGRLESPFPNMVLDNDGKDGEDCGIVNIKDIKVFAIGGASGYGSAPEFYNPSDSGGAGYPAAGIGRRWSWSRRRLWSKWRSEALLEEVLNLVVGNHQKLDVKEYLVDGRT